MRVLEELLFFQLGLLLVVDMGRVVLLLLAEAMEVQVVEDVVSLVQIRVLKEVKVILQVFHLHKVMMVVIVLAMQIMVAELQVEVEQVQLDKMLLV